MVDEDALCDGDNLDVQRRHLGDEIIELGCLDPQNEGNVAEYGLGSLKSQPMGRGMLKMARPFKIKIR